MLPAAVRCVASVLVGLVCDFMGFSLLDWGSGFIWIGNDLFRDFL